MQNEKVVRRDGMDLTKAYENGAKAALKLAKDNQVICAILKNKSPSCGKIRYDGSFTRTLTEKPGITTALFYENGIRVFSESEIEGSPEFKMLIEKR